MSPRDQPKVKDTTTASSGSSFDFSDNNAIGKSEGDSNQGGIDNNDNKSNDEDEEVTKVFYTRDGAPYVICNSMKSFINPTTSFEMSNPEEVIRFQRLNLNLGFQWLSSTSIIRTLLTSIIHFLDKWLIQWWEIYFYTIVQNYIPLSLKRSIIHRGLWNIYLKCHKYLLGRTTGMHPCQSEEYHAITTAMYWSRFLNITPQRIRFSLSQLHVMTPNIVEAAYVEHINVINFLSKEECPKEQQEFNTITGRYLHRTTTTTSSSTKSNRPTLFWVYGGAYLGGDTQGNSAPADWIAKQCGHKSTTDTTDIYDGMDVFLPEFRLAPEYNLNDVLWDICLSYRWLCTRVENPSQNIIFVGLSSGGGLCTRLLQIIAKYEQQQRNNNNNMEEEDDDDGLPSYISNLVGTTIINSTTNSNSLNQQQVGKVQQKVQKDQQQQQYMPMPLAGVLLGPYVDYTREKKGTFLHYAQLDLVVTEAVQDGGLPYLEGFIPRGDRKSYSPVYQTMKGLPPLCVVLSEHEAVYDMSIELVNNARAQGVSVTVGVWKYMCHVAGMLWAFVPEGELSMNFVVDWIRQQQQQQQAEEGTQRNKDNTS